jgi:Heavy metal binding domain
MTAHETELNSWREAFAALRFRFRFLIAIALLAALAACWPWIANAWDRVYARWMPFNSESAVVSDREYFCPMDPGIVSNWSAICPICNMDLISRRKGESQILPSGVVARMQLSPYRVSLAGVRTVEVKQRSEADELLVPTTAVVHWGAESVLYIETMPGMFDGVSVKLGKREGDSYVVLSGVKPGQRIVAMGTLLVDAENRLSPNISTQYFGATSQLAATVPLPVPRSASTPTQPLQAAEILLVEKQKYCPVTQEELGSMGTPVFVEVGSRKVALCCIGCRTGLLEEPEKYLGWLDAKLANKQEQK